MKVKVESEEKAKEIISLLPKGTPVYYMTDFNEEHFLTNDDAAPSESLLELRLTKIDEKLAEISDQIKTPTAIATPPALKLSENLVTEQTSAPSVVESTEGSVVEQDTDVVSVETDQKTRQQKTTFKGRDEETQDQERSESPLAAANSKTPSLKRRGTIILCAIAVVAIIATLFFLR